MRQGPVLLGPRSGPRDGGRAQHIPLRHTDRLHHQRMPEHDEHRHTQPQLGHHRGLPQHRAQHWWRDHDWRHDHGWYDHWRHDHRRYDDGWNHHRRYDHRRYDDGWNHHRRYDHWRHDRWHG